MKENPYLNLLCGDYLSYFKHFLCDFGYYYEEPCSYERGAIIKDIPPSKSLSLFGKKVQRLQLDDTWGSDDYGRLIEWIDSHASFDYVGHLKEEDESNIENAFKECMKTMDDRAQRWLENGDFLLWAVRNKFKEYHTFSEKCSHLLDYLFLYSSDLKDNHPDIFNDIIKELPLIEQDEEVAEKVFNNDDFLLWGISHYFEKVYGLPYI